jgi:multiple sugar transport system ATP-binding protein
VQKKRRSLSVARDRRPGRRDDEWEGALSKVELCGVRKSYGNVQVIHDIDLAVDDGEFLALVGPSGCGKSTLLRMIAGLEEITAGNVLIGERVVNALDPKQRNIAMVFQNYALYPHMTVRENIALNLKISRRPKDEIARRVARAAQLLDIEPLLDRRPGQLSGGQRQRVAMGRAIVRDPSVFLFDEPLSNLDAKLRVQMRSEIKSFHQTVGTTSIYVTHDQIEAMTLSDRIVVLNAGRIEQIGTPRELYQTPENVFVAGFIGSPAMNFFDAVVANGADQCSAVRFADGTSLPLPARLVAEDGTTVTVGIRPEHLMLSGDGAALPARVEHVEPTGAQTHVLLDCAGRVVTAVVNDQAQLDHGVAVTLRVDPARIHVFAKTDGRRVSLAA